MINRLKEAFMNHLIIGAGPAGRHLADKLSEQGESLRIVSRKKRKLPEEIEQVNLDILSAETDELFRWADCVYHTANVPYHRWEQDLPPLWEGILEKSIAGDCSRLVVATNLYAYGEPEGELTINHRWNGNTRKGRVRARLERSCLQAAEKGLIETVLVRSSDYYGPGVRESALGSRFFGPLIKNKSPEIMGNPSTSHSYTYIEDCASVLAAVGKISPLPRKEFMVPCSPAVSAQSLASVLEEILGRRVSLKVMGPGALKLAGLFVPPAREMLEMLYEFEKDFIASGSEEAQILGLKPKDLSEGLKETLNWYKNQ